MSIGSRAASLASAADAGNVAQALATKHASYAEHPGLRKNLIVREMVQMGEIQWVVKNPEDFKVFVFSDAEWDLIRLFDGTRTPTEVKAEYERTHRDPIELQIVADYVDSLNEFNLLDQSDIEKNLAVLLQIKNARKRQAKEKEEGFNPMMILFPVGDPDKFLNRTIKYVRWLWTPPGVALAFVLFFLTASVFVGHYSAIWRETIELYSFLKKPFWDFLMWFLIMTIIGAVHELGHAYAMKSFGGDVHAIGFALINLLPAYYCDSTDSYLFPTKWQRLWVTVAGIYAESFVCVLATGVWVVTYPDTTLHGIAYMTMLYTGVSTIFFNLNPLIPSDGHHIIASLLDLPDLRDESIQFLGLAFQRYVLRLPVEVPVYARRRRRIYLIYAPLTLAYTGLVMFVVATIFQHFYSKIFGELAIIVLIVTLARIFRKRIRLVFRVVRMFYLDKKEFLMAPRTRKAVLGASGALLLLLALPLSRQKITGEALLAPVDRRAVQASEDGTVVQVFVHEGDQVAAGQPLLSISSPNLEEDYRKLIAEEQGLRNAAGENRTSGSASLAFQAEEHRTAVGAAVHRDEMREARLSPRAPFAGRVLTHDTESLVGRYVRAGTPLLEVGNVGELKADLAISERLLTDLSVGSSVTLRFKGRPFFTTRGTIVEISPAVTRPPEPGQIAPAIRPSEVPEQFIAVARFSNSDGDLVSGMVGEARIEGPRRSVLGKSWRIFYHWLRRIFW